MLFCAVAWPGCFVAGLVVACYVIPWCAMPLLGGYTMAWCAVAVQFVAWLVLVGVLFVAWRIVLVA